MKKILLLKKKNFKNGNFQNIFLKSDYKNDSIEISQKEIKKESLSELDEFQIKIFKYLEKKENILFSSHKSIAISNI